MNQELKQYWIDALKSGKYQQGTQGFLRDGKHNYCVLGVLADILDPSDWKLAQCRGKHVWAWNGAHSIFCPPSKYKEKITGIPYSKLVQLNDETRLAFEELADWIDQHV